MKIKKYDTMLIRLDHKDEDVKEKLLSSGLAIIAKRQLKISDLQSEIETKIAEMKEMCPEITAELIILEKEVARQKKYLKDSLKNLKNSPFMVFADVRAEVSPSPYSGYIDLIENTGIDVVLARIEGTEDDIVYPEISNE